MLIDNIRSAFSNFHHQKQIWKFLDFDKLINLCIYWFGDASYSSIKILTNVIDNRWKELRTTYQLSDAYNLFIDEYAHCVDWKILTQTTSVKLNSYVLKKHQDKWFNTQTTVVIEKSTPKNMVAKGCALA
jgi:hypothetical protein